jgi:mannose-1-phosphate guanylyltransferase
MIKAVVIAGGSGTRLWPLSRAAHPKQFLALHGDDSMLQATFKRLDGLISSSQSQYVMRSTASLWLSSFVKLTS